MLKKYPKECEGCYALGSNHDVYYCGADHDKLDNIKLADGIKPASCKKIVRTYEERRIRQWETYPYLYMKLMSKDSIDASKKKHEKCCDCGSKNITYKPMWGKDTVWLCTECAKEYFKRMKNKKNWHSERVDTPRVKSIGLPRGSGGDKGTGDGAPGILD